MCAGRYHCRLGGHPGVTHPPLPALRMSQSPPCLGEGFRMPDSLEHSHICAEPPRDQRMRVVRRDRRMQRLGCDIGRHQQCFVDAVHRYLAERRMERLGHLVGAVVDVEHRDGALPPRR